MYGDVSRWTLCFILIFFTFLFFLKPVFVTGFKRVPMTRTQIHMTIQLNQSWVFPQDQYYPGSHTCFSILELPLYSTKEIMQDRLIEALNKTLRVFQWSWVSPRRWWWWALTVELLVVKVECFLRNSPTHPYWSPILLLGMFDTNL